MENTLIDAGPLIAFFNSKDQYHKKSIAFLKNFNGALWTTWPVITEAMHMLDFSAKAQMNLMKWIERGGLHIFELQNSDASRIIELCTKFQDVPMDLADASLILVSERKKISKVISIDSDFYIYRDIRNKYLDNIFM